MHSSSKSTASVLSDTVQECEEFLPYFSQQALQLNQPPMLAQCAISNLQV